MKNNSSFSSSSLKHFEDIVLQADDSVLPGHHSLDIVVDTPRYITTTPSNPKKAAVVLLIHVSEGIPSIVFIQRADQLIKGTGENPSISTHSGQIAFPGGKLEIGETLKECAFREMEEEIGVFLPFNHPARALTPLYVSVSNFLIHPFVAFKDQLPPLNPNPHEVASIFDSPLTDLDNRYPIQRKDMLVRNKILKNVPFYEVRGKTLWGATALIFTELLHLLKQNQ